MKALAPKLADLEACVEELGTKEAGRPNCSPTGTDFSEYIGQMRAL
jgi:hypothetical protein